MISSIGEFYIKDIFTEAHNICNFKLRYHGIFKETKTNYEVETHTSARASVGMGIVFPFFTCSTTSLLDKF